MSRQVETVEVLRRDEAPAHFLWRGRLYVVRDVLARWVETEPWAEDEPWAAAGRRQDASATGPGHGDDTTPGHARPFTVGFAAAEPVRAAALAGAYGASIPAARRADGGASGGQGSPRWRADPRARLSLDHEVEHQIWRVLASRGRLGQPAEFDLRHTWPGGGWSLLGRD